MLIYILGSVIKRLKSKYSNSELINSKKHNFYQFCTRDDFAARGRRPTVWAAICCKLTLELNVPHETAIDGNSMLILNIVPDWLGREFPMEIPWGIPTSDGKWQISQS